MNITASGQFTNWVKPAQNGNGIDITIENPNGATVIVRKRLGGLETVEGTYTVATSTNFLASGSTYYQVGVALGAFGTAPFNVSIGG